MKIGIVGDLHIKKRIWQGINVEWDALREFKKIIKIAKDQKFEALILAGDTLDPVNSESMKYYQEAVREFPNPIYTILGQHDRNDPSWFTVDGITGESLHKQTLDIGGTVFYGLDNIPKFMLQEELNNVPEGVDYIVMHQFLKDVAPEHAWDLDSAWIPPHVKGVISGDVHNGTTIDYGMGEFHYTGGLVPQRVNEIGNVHSFIIVEDGKVKRQVVKPDRVFESITIESDEDLTKLDIKSSKSDIKPLYYIKYKTSVEGVKEKLDELKDDDTLLIYTRAVTKDIENALDMDEAYVKPSAILKDNIGKLTVSDPAKRLLNDLSDNPSSSVLTTFKEQMLAGI